MKGLQWTIADSSMMESYAYDEKQKELHIKFKNGSHYAYHGVPAEEFEEFEAADSQGKFLKSNIEKNYRYNRID